MPTVFKNLIVFFEDNKIDFVKHENVIRLVDYDYTFYLVEKSSLRSYEYFKKMRYEEKYLHQKLLIFIWFDLWTIKPQTILSKISHICQRSVKVHARKTKVALINSETAREFLNQNHLNEPVNSHKRLGLMLNDKLIALASFGKKRRFKNGTYSGQLNQFATKTNLHINGGLSKLIKHYKSNNDIDNLMTYIDLDWSNGEKFKKIGFKTVETKKEIYFDLNKISSKRIVSTHKTEIFNLGNIKSIIYFQPKT